MCGLSLTNSSSFPLSYVLLFISFYLIAGEMCCTGYLVISDPSAESRDLFGNEQMRFIGTRHPWEQMRSANCWAVSRLFGSTRAFFPCTHLGSMGLSQGL